MPGKKKPPKNNAVRLALIEDRPALFFGGFFLRAARWRFAKHEDRRMSAGRKCFIKKLNKDGPRYVKVNR
jgi:hypothetical protein